MFCFKRTFLKEALLIGLLSVNSLLPLGAQAHSHSSHACVPSSETCDYYQCKENQEQCGEDGYLLHFGERLCQKYLDKQEQSSLALQEWYPKVRLCLQEAVHALPSPLSCTDLQQRAFETHFGCYISTGFCSLSMGDKLQVLEIAGADAFMPKNDGSFIGDHRPLWPLIISLISERKN